MEKATHTGECQACGHLQKLPGGVLSKHGYTKRWGFFSGTCMGANWRPLETHFDLIEKCIASARARVDLLKVRVAELRAPATEEKGMAHVYIPSRSAGRLGSRYQWQEVSLIPVLWTGDYKTGELQTVEYDVKYDTGTERVNAHRSGINFHGTTVLEYATHMRGKFADYLEKEVRQVEEYIVWQTDRLAKWTARELTPVRVAA